MIVKGREIIPPLNYFPYSFLFPLFSYYSYSSFFFLPFRTRPLPLRSPSSFPHLIFILIPLHPRSGRHPASPSNLTLPFLTPCLFLLSNLISPPYFSISPRSSLLSDFISLLYFPTFYPHTYVAPLPTSLHLSLPSDLTPYPPYFPIVLHHLLTLQSHPIPSPNSKIRILLRRPPPTSVQLKL